MTVTAAQVRSVASNDIPASADLDTFVTQAQLLVEEDLADKGFSESRLALIQIYLAAHFAIIKYKYKTSVNVGVAVGFQSAVKVGGFSSTHYGQQAMMLDTSGTLAALDQTSQGNGSGNVILEAF